MSSPILPWLFSLLTVTSRIALVIPDEFVSFLACLVVGLVSPWAWSPVLFISWCLALLIWLWCPSWGLSAALHSQTGSGLTSPVSFILDLWRLWTLFVLGIIFSRVSSAQLPIDPSCPTASVWIFVHYWRQIDWLHDWWLNQSAESSTPWLGSSVRNYFIKSAISSKWCSHQGSAYAQMNNRC